MVDPHGVRPVELRMFDMTRPSASRIAGTAIFTAVKVGLNANTSLVGSPSAADVVNGAGGERQSLGSQPRHEFRDLVGPADALHRDEAGDVRRARRAPLSCSSAWRSRRGDGVDQDSSRGQFFSDGFRQSNDRRL